VSQVVSTIIGLLIGLNVLAIILESVPSIYRSRGGGFWTFEVFSVAVFSIEYVLRIWSCTANSEYAHPIVGRARFALKPLQIIDLLAVLPFYISFGYGDLRFLRLFRLTRIFRIAKLTRYSQALRLMQRVVREKREELAVTVYLTGLLLVCASILMYYVENIAQPDKFSNVFAAMWWSVVTVTTVGYGDVYPITPLGKLLGSAVALVGIGLFALPAAIVTAGFLEELGRRKRPGRRCPHCGGQLNE
jgi:voltage-gated potassium channel